jgi:hypothetical protein
LVVPRLVPFIGNEVEHLIDWSVDDQFACYACHANPSSSPSMLGAAVAGQQG